MKQFIKNFNLQTKRDQSWTGSNFEMSPQHFQKFKSTLLVTLALSLIQVTSCEKGKQFFVEVSVRRLSHNFYETQGLYFNSKEIEGFYNN